MQNRDGEQYLEIQGSWQNRNNLDISRMEELVSSLKSADVVWCIIPSRRVKNPSP